jgi:uncharacterized protein (DUF2235 family)
MSKRIAYCSDGTWDTSAKHTNVYKLSKTLIRNAGQMVFYDDGVGADGNPISKLLGGAFGTGLWDKIKQGYAQIANSYDPSDPLYLFGFSRGAYTARSLAGMIAICGLPTKNFSDKVIETAFNAYRAVIGDERKELLDSLKDNEMFNAQMTMVGVWDTVGSLGIPAAIGLSDPLLYGFLDTKLHPDVHHAYHALAIDEKRSEFQPTLWTSEPSPDQTIEQVWFTGVHSDVGGGEPDDVNGATALSDITLAWMLSKASALGLQIDPAMSANYSLPMDPKFALDTLHSSWNILWGFYKHREIAQDAILANSVRVRDEYDSSYRPPNLKIEDGVLSAHYGSAVVVAPPPVG